MSALASMRTLRPIFSDHQNIRGPFFLCLTDLHQSNTLVDQHWNIQYIIDLELVAVLPPSFLQPPYWLTNEAVDPITPESYQKQHEEFLKPFEGDERALKTERNPLPKSTVMHRAQSIR
ncbi:uncharacterized protein Z520_11762 [Fonsecaea multimorphosa CBS 102226]|uniref:Aminoglycoside phosphotransferase domain-containing protein n=1 Tax=Fonsecaea multimorphosa CBS 102226 TaxID=1442371 RepID=A0A0D2I5N7_9EURO|nr:uncharacterized protein Z520_11762 [Fonsecaea multimorphosa CBS 102226]KIX92586.1 hypothetical protein Z520_11762 [Fonsecaea multimorphosa CBS 102226]